MSAPNPPRSIALFTRRNPEGTAEAVRRLAEMCAEGGVELRVPSEEVEKLGLSSGLSGAVLDADPHGADLAVVLGGDGTILTALRRYAGRDVPVFAMNFGEIGFLATVERDGLDAGFARALAGEFEVLALPALTVTTSPDERVAVNDISFHRRQDLRVAELGYSVVGEELGEVRCDGLVVATPAGSTGYNLANGGPVLAWGVSGYVVSFIAPHTLTARALVVAPHDVLQVVNRSPYDPVDLTTDGRLVCALEPQERVEIRFGEGLARLAQVPGATFYKRMRDKFGHLSH
ncbi:MAG: NAD(+)/NADH kinase [Actinomycetota bacterium]|nr:NAD(+)/NADH kinase [Actinomycetota bacterium]